MIADRSVQVGCVVTYADSNLWDYEGIVMRLQPFGTCDVYWQKPLRVQGGEWCNNLVVLDKKPKQLLEEVR